MSSAEEIATRVSKRYHEIRDSGRTVDFSTLLREEIRKDGIKDPDEVLEKASAVAKVINARRNRGKSIYGRKSSL